jgi:branched-chain amino acid transport system ATP-binding protein
MLEVTDLHAGYGDTKVLHGLDFSAQKGRVLALLGRNGAGKTTTMKAIVGLLKLDSGEVRLDGEKLSGRPAYEIARRGIGYVPETRDIFPSLTVSENLKLATRIAGANPAWTIDKIVDFFPNLAARMTNGGNELSGGEQQMLSIARALLTDPRLLILDEPTEGLAPIIVGQIHDKLGELKRNGLTMVLVEQNFGFATSLADDVCVVGRGQIVWRGSAEEIRQDKSVQKQWLGV